MRTIETTVYKFSELSDAAKERAIQDWNEDGLNYEWWDAVYDDAKTIGALMGIKIDRIFSPVFGARATGHVSRAAMNIKREVSRRSGNMHPKMRTCTRS